MNMKAIDWLHELPDNYKAVVARLNSVAYPATLSPETKVSCMTSAIIEAAPYGYCDTRDNKAWDKAYSHYKCRECGYETITPL